MSSAELVGDGAGVERFEDRVATLPSDGKDDGDDRADVVPARVGICQEGNALATGSDC